MRKFDKLINDLLSEETKQPLNIKRGHEFGKAGAGRAGAIMDKKTKSKLAKKQRQDWRKDSKNHY